jgi:hypothetical protein
LAQADDDGPPDTASTDLVTVEAGNRHPWRWVGATLAVVLIAVAVPTFFTLQRQDAREREALSLAVGQADAADAELRKGMVDLDKAIGAAQAARSAAVDVLGEDARSVKSLDDALQVALKLKELAEANPLAVPSSAAGAVTAQKQDEDALALVGPVRDSLDAARETCLAARDDRLIIEARERLHSAITGLSQSLTVAGEYVDLLDAALSAPIEDPSELIEARSTVEAAIRSGQTLIDVEVVSQDVTELDAAAAKRDDAAARIDDAVERTRTVLGVLEPAAD